MRFTARMVGGLVVVGVLAVVAVTVDLPGAPTVREWAEGLGPAAVAVFLPAYAVATAAPVPRTVFNLAAGLLFGEFVGIAVAVVATAVSGLLGFALARWLGREFVLRHAHRAPVAAIDTRLAEGGARAVASLRLIPVIPFAPLSYCCGVSALRLRPYLVGTAVGSVPGTVAVVVLGDALTGGTPPALVACYAVFAVLGGLGLLRATSGPRARAAGPVARAGDPDPG